MPYFNSKILQFFCIPIDLIIIHLEVELFCSNQLQILYALLLLSHLREVHCIISLALPLNAFESTSCSLLLLLLFLSLLLFLFLILIISGSDFSLCSYLSFFSIFFLLDSRLLFKVPKMPVPLFSNTPVNSSMEISSNDENNLVLLSL